MPAQPTPSLVYLVEVTGRPRPAERVGQPSHRPRYNLTIKIEFPKYSSSRAGPAYSLQLAGQGQTAITSSMEENEVAKEADPGEKDIHDHEKRHLPLLPAWRLVSRVRRGRAGVGEERSLM